MTPAKCEMKKVSEQLSDTFLSKECLVVTLEDDLLFVPAKPYQMIPYSRDHVVESADVGVDAEAAIGRRRNIAALPDDLRYIILHIATVACVAFILAAQRSDVVEVGMLSGNRLKLIFIVEVRQIARSIDKPYLLAVAAILAALWEEPLRKATHRRDAGSGCDHEGVADGLPQSEESMRAVELNSIAHIQIADQIREEATVHPVDTQVKLVAALGRGDGVGAGLLLPAGVFGNHGDELASLEGKSFILFSGKFKVVALG